MWRRFTKLIKPWIIHEYTPSVDTQAYYYIDYYYYYYYCQDIIQNIGSLKIPPSPKFIITLTEFYYDRLMICIRYV